MEIRIASYIAASFLLEREPNKWHALVLLDSGKQTTDYLKTHTRSFACLHFDDVEAAFPNKQPPTKTLIQQALDFATGKDNLLVSCRAGQGRSVATAYVISCREHGVDEALKLLNPTRHFPNRLVVSLGDAILEDSTALQRFDDWRQRHAHVKLSDYYDEMEKEFDTLEAAGATNRICTR